ncbi:MAG: PHP domain-containing protein [Elusimicrobiota bacterium]
MSRRVDLHTHSSYSDGTSSPAEVVRRAKERGVELLVLSDHDTVSGYPEAEQEGLKIGQKVLCGIEINTGTEDRIHILGYGIDWRSKALAERLEFFRARRQKRVGLIVERLRAQGVDLTLEEVVGVSRQTLGRPHVADALRRRKLVGSRQEAFDRFLAKGASAYVDPMGPSVQEAIETIREAGGWASLAHPGLIRKPADLERWVAWGLEALEIYYPSHTASVMRRLRETADRFGLKATGGSDYHGPGTGREELGSIEIPGEDFEKIAQRLETPPAGRTLA